MIDRLSHVAFTRLSVTLWDIWWSRRKAIHEEIFQSPSATHHFICKFIEELDIAPGKTSSAPITMSRTMVRPKAPLHGYDEIHVDASISQNHTDGAAATVCRDGKGNCMGQFILGGLR